MYCLKLNTSIYLIPCFKTDFTSGYDYAMVFKMEGSEGNYKQSTTAKFVVNVLIENEFEVFCYLSVQGDELIILLKPSVWNSKCMIH